MNIWQRLILIFGAIVFFVVLMDTPKVCILQGSILETGGKSGLAKVIDIRTASVRGVSVIGATALLFFAFKSKKKD